MDAVLYIHGKGGAASESERFGPLFPGRAVTGLDYRSFTPWETGPEIRAAAEDLRRRCDNLDLIANSVGAYFCLHAGLNELVRTAYFISPVVDMEELIGNMMRAAGVTEAELCERGVVPTVFGEDLSWEYLTYVRSHPVDWRVPTHILYGQHDELTPFETIRRFAAEHGASLTVMEEGGHWFHTEEELRFLDGWIREREEGRK